MQAPAVELELLQEAAVNFLVLAGDGISRVPVSESFLSILKSCVGPGMRGACREHSSDVQGPIIRSWFECCVTLSNFVIFTYFNGHEPLSESYEAIKKQVFTEPPNQANGALLSVNPLQASFGLPRHRGELRKFDMWKPQDILLFIVIIIITIIIIIKPEGIIKQ